VGLANGHLDQNTLHLPPVDFLLDLCLLGPDQIKQDLTKPRLTAHDGWPFVTAALHQPGNGTPKPFWFLVSLVDDIGQLIAQLNRASRVSTKIALQQRIATTIIELNALRAFHTLPNSSDLATVVRNATAVASKRLENLMVLEIRNRATDRRLSSEAIILLSQVSDGSMTLSDAYHGITQELLPAVRTYWARQLSEAASEPDDKRFLIEIIRDTTLQAAHTGAKKALRLVDVLAFGPHIELD